MRSAGVEEASLHSGLPSVRSIIYLMGSKLSDVNPYLRDPAIRKEGLWVSAKTSSAIEGIREPFAKRSVSAVYRKRGSNVRAARNGRKTGGSPR